VDEAQPAVGCGDFGHECIGVCVLERLADSDEPEAEGKQAEGRTPGAKRVTYDLTCGANGEHGAEVEVLAKMRVGDGGKKPAGKVGSESVIESH